jgi:hypothetical protein
MIENHISATGAALFVVAGCAAATTVDQPGDGGSGGSGGSGGAELTGGFGGAGFDCAAGTEFIYLIGQDGYLVRFDPEHVAFTAVGVLHCAPGATPFSMAVGRDGFAWVEYTDLGLYRVDITTAECQPTDYLPSQIGFERFGMGMVASSPESPERLYVADFDGSGIGRLDLGTLVLEFVGAYDAVFGSAELTGTADGRLYGFFPDESPAVFAELDPERGSVLSTTPLPVTAGLAWAFAFWGGDFYLFTAPSGPSRVDRYRPADGSTTFVANVPSVIVGAGVSICAPLEPPQ